jgi:hypothetical protein
MAAQVRLTNMHERHRALTPPIADSYSEAACVCLNRHHISPTMVALCNNGADFEVAFSWITPDARQSGAWANAIDATEAGAYGCVIACVEWSRELFAVRRAETGTGADYYIGPLGSGENDLEDCLRLEVSGLNLGDRSDIARRLTEKVDQAQRGNSNLPAVAGVIGFSAKIVLLQDVPETA